MIRTHRGRRGWGADKGGLVRPTGLAVVILALALFGCSSQKKPGEGANGPGGAGANGIGEGGVGPGGGSSLAQMQSGTLGQNGQGPLSDIHFGYNDYAIQQQDSDVLRSNADWLQKHPNSRVQIEGHCDERGSEEYNIALGAKRAQSAKDYLQTLGITPDRLSTISYGKELPICTEHTEDCWQQNRRDHFAVAQ
jgi:peptidoglycan-associated lipoprotein